MFTRSTTGTGAVLARRSNSSALRAACAIALGALALVAAHPAAAAPDATQPEAAPTSSAPRTLDDAVASGRLERGVLTELRHDGAVEAIVVTRYHDVLQDVASSDDEAEIAAARQAFTAQENDALRGIDGVQVIRAWRNLPTSLVRFTTEQGLLDVLASDDVVAVSANEQLRAQSSAHLSYIRQPQAQQSGYAGAGAYVAVLDTGTDFQRYSDFGYCPQAGAASCKVASSWEVAPNDGVLDADGHGSNVAAIVSQVAPGARLITYDVFDGKSTSPEYVETALDHLIGLKGQGINVVSANMSLGGGASSAADCSNLSAATQKYAAVFQRLRAAGIIPVVAAGNSAGGGAGTYGVGWPGCVASALTVGATYDAAVGSRTWSFFTPSCTDTTTAADRVTCFSQTGPSVDIFAPGAEIAGASGTYTGTSQAAPHVAGAIAVLAAARPSAPISQIESTLVNNGPFVTDGKYGASYAVTRRRLDLYASLSALLSQASADTTVPSVTVPVEDFDDTKLITSTTVPVKLTWSSSDAGGIAANQLWVSQNGGAWVQDTTIASQTQTTYALTRGIRYQFAVRAQDRAGNWSDYQYSQLLTPSVSDDTIFSLAGSAWSRVSWPASFGGTTMTASSAGTPVTFSFTGRDVAYVGPKFSTAGRVRVYCDGYDMGLRDLYSATMTTQNVVSGCRFSASGAHTMKLVVEGTSGRPRVDVDAFAVLA